MVSLKNDICSNCNNKLIVEETPNSVHFGKLICSECGKWHKWLKSPDNENKRTKTSKYKIKQINDFYGLEEEFCFFCLRKKYQLGESETLTRDHINELSKGGKDEPKNIQILCTACHKLKNWMRLYVNWHQKRDINE